MKRLALVGMIVAAFGIGLLFGHVAVYGPPGSSPSGVAVEMAGQCIGYTWSNGIGETGLWTGCNQ